MATLIKINNVEMYINFNSIESYNCYALLKQKNLVQTGNVKLTQITDNDMLRKQCEFISSQLLFGPDFTEVAFTDFPIVIWTESYDDYERFAMYSNNSSDLANSNLILHSDLVK